MLSRLTLTKSDALDTDIGRLSGLSASIMAKAKV